MTGAGCGAPERAGTTPRQQLVFVQHGGAAGGDQVGPTGSSSASNIATQTAASSEPTPSMVMAGRDQDQDGVPDERDMCPTVPEDRDGDQDDDGCPESSGGDRDSDGLLDTSDRCPDAPEDRDGFEDQDGCPDPDNDSDRIPDVSDACPNDPETYNGRQDADGCPDR